jgi:hypothetical protein
VQEAKYRATFESQLVKRGFVLDTEVAEDNVTHYVKVHAPFTVLCQTAEKLRVRMPLKTKDAKLMDDPGCLDSLFSLPGPLKAIVDTTNVIPNDEDIASAPFKTVHLDVCGCVLCGCTLITFSASSTTRTKTPSSVPRSAVCLCTTS